MGIKLGLTLHEEYRLRVFENRVLRKIFEPKMEEVAGGWGRLHNEELLDLHSPNIIKAIKSKWMRGARHVVRMGENRYAYRISVGKREGKRPL